MSNKVIYEPNQYAKIGFFKTMLVVIKNTVASKELILQLYKRDFLMQYKKSFLGLGWMIFGPIMGIVSWVLMDSAGVLSPGDVGVPYPVYLLFLILSNFFNLMKWDLSNLNNIDDYFTFNSSFIVFRV